MVPTYSSPSKSFVDVPITSAGVDTVAFLKASEGLLGLFGMSALRGLGVNMSIHSVTTPGIHRAPRYLKFGRIHSRSKRHQGKHYREFVGSLPTIFHSHVALLYHGMQKVRARYDIKHGTTPDSYSTLERLVEGEVDEEKRTATQGLMWLLRGLSLTCGALQETQADEKKELSTAFNSSYQLTLRKHHNFFVAKTFSVSNTALFFPLPSPVSKWGDGRERGKEPSFVHIRGSATFFFSPLVHSGCRVSCLTFADAVSPNLI